MTHSKIVTVAIRVTSDEIDKIMLIREIAFS